MAKRITDLIRKLMGKNSITANDVQLNEPVIKRLLHSIQNTLEEEISCDEVYDLIDQYVELTVQGVDTSELMPLVHHHLEICRDCKEEYEALLSILKSNP